MTIVSVLTSWIVVELFAAEGTFQIATRIGRREPCSTVSRDGSPTYRTPLMPHSAGQPIPFFVLAVLAFAGPLLAQGVEEQVVPRAGLEIADPEEIEAFVLELKPINKLSVRTRPEAGEMPTDYATAKFAREGEVAHRMGVSRATTETVMMWEAPAICHRPLYFEDVNLERHGYKIPIIQPALSAAHFFGRVPLLPYLMVSEPHRDCQYTLGHYRPGDYAPYSLYVPRLRLDASLAEAAVVAGVILAFP